jgi:tetratricopeptide (TPR) repeat protein
MNDLETVIQRYQKALDTTPENYPDQAGRLQSLGTGYLNRYKIKKAMNDLETAIQRFQESIDQFSSPARDRLRSGKILLALYAEPHSGHQLIKLLLQLCH